MCLKIWFDRESEKLCMCVKILFNRESEKFCKIFWSQALRHAEFACTSWLGSPAGNIPAGPAASRDGRLVYVRAWTGPHRLTETETDDSLGVACRTRRRRFPLPAYPVVPTVSSDAGPVLLLRRLFWLQIFKASCIGEHVQSSTSFLELRDSTGLTS